MTNPTPHGQVPEALRLAHIFDNPLPPEWPDMVAAAAELRRQHARIAELEAQIEALSGVQALSAGPGASRAARAPSDSVAAPAIGDELRDALVAVSAAIAERDDRAAQKMIGEILAASPTPPAEQPIGEVVVTKTRDGQIVAVTRQDDEGRILSVIATSDPTEQQVQTGAVYAELPDFDSGGASIWEAIFKWANATRGSDAHKKAEAVSGAVINALRDFADRTHALRIQAAPKAEPGEPFDECFPGEPRVAVPQGLIGAACFAIRNKRDGGKVLEQLRRYSVGDLSQPLAPKLEATQHTQHEK